MSLRLLMERYLRSQGWRKTHAGWEHPSIPERVFLLEYAIRRQMQREELHTVPEPPRGPVMRLNGSVT